MHNKRVGDSCCEKKTTINKSAKSTSTNKKSSTTSSQCLGTTKKGTRCKNKTTNSNGRCHLH